MLRSSSPTPIHRFRQVLRKPLSNGSDPTFYEDLSGPIRSGMAKLGYNLTNPLGIALDLRDRKVGATSELARSTNVGRASPHARQLVTRVIPGVKILASSPALSRTNRRPSTLIGRISFPFRCARKRLPKADVFCGRPGTRHSRRGGRRDNQMRAGRHRGRDSCK